MPGPGAALDPYLVSWKALILLPFFNIRVDLGVDQFSQRFSQSLVFVGVDHFVLDGDGGGVAQYGTSRGQRTLEQSSENPTSRSSQQSSHFGK